MKTLREFIDIVREADKISPFSNFLKVYKKYNPGEGNLTDAAIIDKFLDYGHFGDSDLEDCPKEAFDQNLLQYLANKQSIFYALQVFPSSAYSQEIKNKLISYWPDAVFYMAEDVVTSQDLLKAIDGAVKHGGFDSVVGQALNEPEEFNQYAKYIPAMKSPQVLAAFKDKLNIGVEIDENKMISEVSGYKKVMVRDLNRWKQIAADNDYHIQDIKNGNFQAWREGPHGGPHLTGFFFNGDDTYPAEFWIRVPK